MTGKKFISYSVALVFDEKSRRWSPVIFCIEESRPKSNISGGMSQAGVFNRDAIKSNTSDRQVSGGEKETVAQSKEYVFSSPMNGGGDTSKNVNDGELSGGRNELASKTFDDNILAAENLGSLNSHALSKFLIDSPSLGEVDSTKFNPTLKRERIPYVSVVDNQDGSGGGNHENIKVFYHVARLEEGWLIVEVASAVSQVPLAQFVIPISKAGWTSSDQDPFELDRILLNRLYFLAFIASTRNRIHEKLVKVLKSGGRDSVDSSNVSPFIKRVSDCFSYVFNACSELGLWKFLLRTPLRGMVEILGNKASRWDLKKFFDYLQGGLPWMVGVTSGLSCFFAIALIWLKVGNYSGLFFDCVRFAFFSMSVFGVFSFGFALMRKQGKTSGDYEIDELAKMAAEFRSDLSQINLKVASGYAEFNGSPLEASLPPPEGVLRKIDDILQVKSSLDSLDKVIATQLQSVSTDHKKKQELRLHVYQNIVAAGSGIFTGFFTYEVGESVLKFIHATQYADDRSLQYWLFTKAGVFASLQGTGQPSVQAPVLPVVGSISAEKGATLENATTAQSISELDHFYHENFVHHELTGQAWLLTITIVVSWIAGYIGWHKPHSEHSSGHENHS